MYRHSMTSGDIAKESAQINSSTSADTLLYWTVKTAEHWDRCYGYTLVVLYILLYIYVVWVQSTLCSRDWSNIMYTHCRAMFRNGRKNVYQLVALTVIARAVAAAVCDVIGRFPTVLPGKQVSHVTSRRR